VRVGGGECSHLPSEALRIAGGEFSKWPNSSGNYQWGTLYCTLKYVNGQVLNPHATLPGVEPGDIIQYSTHHTAIVAAVDQNGWPTELYEQNIGGVRKVFEMTRNLKKGNGLAWIHFYHPVDRTPPAPGAYELSIVNNTAGLVTPFLQEQGMPPIYLINQTVYYYVNGVRKSKVLHTLTTDDTLNSYMVITWPASVPTDTVTLFVNSGTVALSHAVATNQNSITLQDAAGYQIVNGGANTLSIHSLQP
jgi:hypothetical protein